MTDRETIAQLETRLAESESLRASHQREIDSLKAKLAELESKYMTCINWNWDEELRRAWNTSETKLAIAMDTIEYALGLFKTISLKSPAVERLATALAKINGGNNG